MTSSIDIRDARLPITVSLLCLHAAPSSPPPPPRLLRPLDSVYGFYLSSVSRADGPRQKFSFKKDMNCSPSVAHSAPTHPHIHTPGTHGPPLACCDAPWVVGSPRSLLMIKWTCNKNTHLPPPLRHVDWAVGRPCLLIGSLPYPSCPAPKMFDSTRGPCLLRQTSPPPYIQLIDRLIGENGRGNKPPSPRR